jgi:hypothetical protein
LQFFSFGVSVNAGNATYSTNSFIDVKVNINSGNDEGTVEFYPVISYSSELLEFVDDFGDNVGAASGNLFTAVGGISTENGSGLWVVDADLAGDSGFGLGDEKIGPGNLIGQLSAPSTNDDGTTISGNGHLFTIRFKILEAGNGKTFAELTSAFSVVDLDEALTFSFEQFVDTSNENDNEDEDDETDEPLTASAGYGGAKAFANYVYIFTADTGYAVDVIYIDGVPDTSYQGAASAVIDVSEGFDNVVSIVATFAHTINFQPPTNGTLSVSRSLDGTSEVNSGDIVCDGETLYITATPTNDSYVLDGDLVIKGLEFVSAGVYTVLAERGADTPFVSASFKDATPPSDVAHTITLPSGNMQYDGHNASDPITSSVATAKSGASVTITAVPYVNTYRLESLNYVKTGEDGASPVPIMTTVNANNQYTFTMPDYDITITAEFGLSNYIKVDPQLNTSLGAITQSGSGAKGSVVTLSIIPQIGGEFIPDTFDIYNTQRNVSMFTYAPERIAKVSDTQYKYTVLNEPVILKAEFKSGATENKTVVFSADSPVAAKVNNKLVSFVPATGGNITFELVPLDGYEVTKVYTDNGVITPSGVGVYTLFGANAHTIVYIDTKENWTTADKIIYTAEELIAFRNEVNAGANDYAGQTIRLGKDIDLTGAGWTLAIGQSRATAFAGTFDGDGYTITLDGVGLFKNTIGALVKNLNTIGSATSAAIIGNESFGSAVVNCKNYASITGPVGMASQINYVNFDPGKSQLPEPYVGLFRCVNYGSVTSIFGNGRGAAANGGVGTFAQRMIKCGNEGTVTSLVSNATVATALGNLNNDVSSVYAPGMFIDRSYNTGTLISSTTSYAASMEGLAVTNSYNTGNIVVTAEHVSSNPTDPAHINGIIGYLLVKNVFVTGVRSGDVLDIKTDVNFDAVYMQKYGVSDNLMYGDSINTYTHLTNPPPAPLSAAFAADGKFAWESAAPLEYSVTFLGGSVAIPGHGTNNEFTLPAGTYEYTYGATTSSFNLLSDGKIINLASTVTFDLPDASATVEIEDETATTPGVYTLLNGEYNYIVRQPGKFPYTDTFAVSGTNRTIVVAPLANAIDVVFDIESGVSLTVNDAGGGSIAAKTGTTYSLAEGVIYSK